MKIGMFLLLLFAGSAAQAQVTYDRILHADKEPQNWLTYSGGYASRRYSELKQINRRQRERPAIEVGACLRHQEQD